VNKFKGNSDHYLTENGDLNGEFKYVIITWSRLKLFSISCMLTVTVLSKLGNSKSM